MDRFVKITHAGGDVWINTAHVQTAYAPGDDKSMSVTMVGEENPRLWLFRSVEAAVEALHQLVGHVDVPVTRRKKAAKNGDC